MNPYLEHKSVWHNFHQRLTTRLADEIAKAVRPTYITKVDDNVYIHELSAEERFLLGRPDVGIARSREGQQEFAGTPAVCEPMFIGQLAPQVDPVRESFIEIRDAEDRSLVTVIELLSPTNKAPGADRDQYVSERKCLLHSTVNFVEIDLLRGGVRHEVEGLPQCDYAIMVSRYVQRPSVWLWSLMLKDRLP